MDKLPNKKEEIQAKIALLKEEGVVDEQSFTKKVGDLTMKESTIQTEINKLKDKKEITEPEEEIIENPVDEKEELKKEFQQLMQDYEDMKRQIFNARNARAKEIQELRELIEQENNKNDMEKVERENWLKIPVGSIIETEDVEVTPDGMVPATNMVKGKVVFAGDDYLQIETETGSAFRRYVDMDKNFNIYIIERADETVVEPAPETTKIESQKNEVLEKFENKEGEKEVFDKNKLKNEVEKIIIQFADKMKEKGVVYDSLEITGDGNRLRMVTKMSGTGMKGLMIGKPKFIVDLETKDGGIVVPFYDFDANSLVNTFTPKDKIEELVNTLGDKVKAYIESDRKKEIKGMSIENGNLVIEYK